MRTIRHAIPATALLVIAGGLGLSSCNESSSSDKYLSPVDLAVTNFTIKGGIQEQELDTVFFSIDLNKQLIFNADSLRKGTDVSKVVASITFSGTVSEAVIEMSGGTTREGEIDYKTNPTDSIDFTGDVRLHIKADDGNIGMTYRIKVNVHQLDADSLYWDKTAKTTLPSRLSLPKRQKTVTTDEGAVTLLEEKDGTFTLSKCADLGAFNWEKQKISLPFVPDISTFTSTGDALWILDKSGELYTGPLDGSSWTRTGEVWCTMIGSYTGTVVGLRKSGSQILFVQYPDKGINQCVIPADFPVSGGSNFVTLTNKWTSSPVAFFTGGVTESGELDDSTWAFDGTEWICLSSGGVPPLEGASMIPYYNFRPSSQGNVMIEYNVWMIVGGKLADGSFNRTVYISYDNGVNWSRGADSLQLPDDIPAMTGCDNIVAESELSADLTDQWKAAKRGSTRADYELDGDIIRWGCPYVYLFGGYGEDGKLYDTVWKGVLSRLTFMPII